MKTTAAPKVTSHPRQTAHAGGSPAYQEPTSDGVIAGVVIAGIIFLVLLVAGVRTARRRQCPPVPEVWRLLPSGWDCTDWR